MENKLLSILTNKIKKDRKKKKCRGKKIMAEEKLKGNERKTEKDKTAKRIFFSIKANWPDEYIYIYIYHAA